MFRKVLSWGLITGLAISICNLACSESESFKEGSYLYRVTTVRATPGQLNALIDLYQSDLAKKATSVDARPFMMRHSQGDHWDLLLMYPMGSTADYFHPDRVKKRESVQAQQVQFNTRRNQLVAFKTDQFALGVDPERLAREFSDNAFFHVEMFHALPGKHEQLLEQRRMENNYLVATGQTDNYIFTTVAGTDVDIFTIGFYPSIVEFAKPAPVSNEQAEKEAVAAGFEGRAFIGTYLRSLIGSHHDTLAVAVN